MALISQQDVQDKIKAQDKLVAEWAAKARARIDKGIKDAHAHATTALTETLRRTADGRPTLARLRKSPSYQAAVSRLIETGDALVSIVKDARWEFYLRERERWADLLPEEWRRWPDGHSEGKIGRIQNAAIHGETVRQSVAVPITDASRSLQTALTVAASRSLMSNNAAAMVLKTWRDRAANTLGNRMQIILRSGMTFADKLAGRDAMKPELLEPDPSLPF